MPRGHAVASAPGPAPVAAPAQGLEAQNQAIRIGFRQKVLAQSNANSIVILNRYRETWADGTQTSVELIENNQTGRIGVREIDGETRNIPRVLRAKRGPTAIDHEGDLDGCEASDNDEAEGPTRARRRIRADGPAVELDANERMVADFFAWKRTKRQRRNSTTSKRTAASAKKATARSDPSVPTPRRSSRVRARRSTDAAVEGVGEGDRSVAADREGDGEDNAASSRVTRTSAVTVKGEMDSVNDLFSGIEIASVADSESTRVFSRASSEATTIAPEASTSRMPMP